jgi:UDP:flavonoid glycosyltransferase YjiC (YdhE family)
MDHPEFIKIEQPPFRHAFLGPVVWAPTLTEKITNIKDNSIYITMGSSGNNHVLTEIAKACLRLNRHLIISGLNNSEAEKLMAFLPELKTKAIIKSLVNADEILENCDLTICHGGSGTVYQSLKANTPVLCFPHNPDQGLVAMAVKDGNWGSAISPSQSNAENIYQAIVKLLNDKKTIQAVGEISKKLQAHDTKKNWLAFLSRITSTSVENQILEETK